MRPVATNDESEDEDLAMKRPPRRVQVDGLSWRDIGLLLVVCICLYGAADLLSDGQEPEGSSPPKAPSNPLSVQRSPPAKANSDMQYISDALDIEIDPPPSPPPSPPPPPSSQMRAIAPAVKHPASKRPRGFARVSDVH